MEFKWNCDGCGCSGTVHISNPLVPVISAWAKIEQAHVDMKAEETIDCSCFHTDITLRRNND